MRHLLAVAALALASVLPTTGHAAVNYALLATPLVAAPNPGGGNADGTGIWFNPVTGYAETRGFLFPSPLYEDGKFFLVLDTFNYATPEAEIFTQGFFSRGNGVVYASAVNVNPAWFGVGASIGPGTGYQSPGAGYPDLGPNFGNAAPGRGFVGLTIRDASGSLASDVFYGFADITLSATYGITLNAFAYETVRGRAITTFVTSPVPEAPALAMGALGLLCVALVARRRRAA